MLGQNQFVEPNGHVLTFCHPILIFRVTHGAPVELLRHGHQPEVPPRSSQYEANHDHEESLSDKCNWELGRVCKRACIFQVPGYLRSSADNCISLGEASYLPSSSRQILSSV